MNETAVPKPKKSVALSGVTAGNTALCSVGRSGNDLHYRGYDILEVAETCDFEEIAYLLIHGKLPNKAQLAAYKIKLKNLRGLPAPVRAVLEQLPAATHPMDVMRTGASALGCVLPEEDAHDPAGAREIADHFVGCFGSMLCYWYHFSHNGQRIHVSAFSREMALVSAKAAMPSVTNSAGRRNSSPRSRVARTSVPSSAP